jgi:uncharacterized membrane protein
MLPSRPLNLALRASQFLTAAILLGLTSSFLHQRSRYDSNDVFNRLVYTLVVAVVALVFALVWMLPIANASILWAVDLALAAAWLAVFGLLQDWYGAGGLACGGKSWDWERKWSSQVFRKWVY